VKKLSIFLILFFVSFKAFAHPHVWVATDLNLITDSNFITGIGVNWSFDEMYSSAFMQDADLNNDKKLDLLEEKAIEKQVMHNAIKTLRPFIMLKFNGFDVTEFSFNDLKISYDKKTEKVSYDFKIMLDKPQKLSGNHKIAIFDNEYYVDFEQSYNLKLPKNCTFDLEEDSKVLIYNGIINPETYKLSCK
jgi:ABC-type uncharacterized transport system substrate-binding protein